MKTAIRIDNKTCMVKFYGADFFPILAVVRNLPGAIPKLKVKPKHWIVPITKSNIMELVKKEFEVDISIMEQLYKKKEKSTCKIPEEIKSKLRPYQIDGVQKIEEFEGRALLADEMGLGKTIQAISYALMNTSLRPMLCVVPNTIKKKWKKEFDKWSDSQEDCQILYSGQEVEKGKSVYIINYEILCSLFVTIKKSVRSDGKKTKRAYVNDLFKEIGFKFVVVDECHKIKNSSANRTKAVKAVSKGSKFLAISGTPIINRPIEIFNTLNLLRPDIFNSFFNFTNRYCGAKHNGFGWDYSGASNLEELNQLLLDTVMIRRLKKDVLKDLPEKTVEVVLLDIDKSAAIPLEIDEESDSENVLREIEHDKQNAFRMKKKEVINWIQDYYESGGNKLVIFCIHHFVIDELFDYFSGYFGVDGIYVVKLDGRDSLDERESAVDEFQDNDECKLFIGNIQAAGVGIDLFTADNCIFVELPWTPGECVQAEDRLHRIGQKNAVVCHYLIAEGTIEEDIIKLIDKKKKVLTKTIDGVGEVESTTVLSEIIKKIKERRN